MELTNDRDHNLWHAKTGEYCPEEGSINEVVRFGCVEMFRYTLNNSTIIDSLVIVRVKALVYREEKAIFNETHSGGEPEQSSASQVRNAFLSCGVCGESHKHEPKQ